MPGRRHVDDVHAHQGRRDAQAPADGTDGRARRQHPAAAGHEVSQDALGRTRHGSRLRRRRGFLAGLEPPVAGRDRHLAEQPRRDLAAPVGVLVEVQDIGRWPCAVGRASQAGTRPPGRRPRAGRWRRRGSGSSRRPGSRPPAPSSRRPRRRRAACRHRPRRGAGPGPWAASWAVIRRVSSGVVTRGVGQRPHDHRRGARGPRDCLAHRPGGGQDLRPSRDRPASRRAAAARPPPRAPPRAGRRPGRGPGARCPGRRCP